MTDVKYDIGGGKEIIAEYDENGFMEITRECFEALIEKQIPKKPIKESMCPSNAFESWDKYYCQNCNKFLHSGARSLIKKLKMSMYCCDCGQKIDWSDEE